MFYIGIDPGVTGALALIDGSQVLFWDAPTTTVGGVNKNHTMLDPHAASSILRELWTPEVFVMLEQVNAMPGIVKGGARVSIGATSAFNFGQGYGMWIGILAALQYRYELVRPAIWKKWMCPGSKGPDKDASRIRARQLYPQAVESLNRKKDHGRADALLLAAFALETHAAKTRKAANW